MPSTAAITAPLVAGYTQLGGIQVSPQGAILTGLKLFTIGITSTSVITATSTAIAYTPGNLTTNDIPIALQPSTGIINCDVGSMFVSASSQLTVQWTQHGTSTTGIPGLAAPGAAYSLWAVQVYAQSPSTTT